MQGILSIFILIFFFSSGSGINAQQFLDMTNITGFASLPSNKGIAIADVNNDGLEDIYMCRRDKANLLYINNGNFQFEEKAISYGLNYQGKTQMAAWIDIENDGDLDLFIANENESHKFYKNEGGYFIDQTESAGIYHEGFVKSLNVVDFDNDGYLDIYISNFLEENVLYKNIDGDHFLNVINSSGISDVGSSMASVFFDFDNDGDQDLYQVHDGNSSNLLFENIGSGLFINISAESKSDLEVLGMGVDAGDVNNDGYLDLYITNLYENALLINRGDGTFEDVAQIVGVDDIGMGWGTMIFDCNNDSKLDIYVANESNFGVNGISKIKNLLYLNKGGLEFEEMDYNGSIQNEYRSFSSAFADFDKDGRSDLIVNNADENGSQIFHNISESHNYIAFKCIGKESNAQAIGTRIWLYNQNGKANHYVKGTSGWLSQNSSIIKFGLGQSEEIDSIIVEWPSGKRQSLEYFDVNQTNIIIEPGFSSSGPLVWTVPAFPTQFDDVTVYFDAKEGNGGLAGYDGDVYAHTGVITSSSTNPSDWKHTVGTWGTDVSETKMKNEGNDVYSLTYNINDFYSINDGELVEKLAFVFRNVDGSVTGREAGGGDIFIDVYPPEDGLFALITSPDEEGEFVYSDDTLLISVNTSQKAKLDLYDNSVLIYSDSIEDLTYEYIPLDFGLRIFDFVFSLDGDTLNGQREVFVVNNDFENLDSPDNIVNGLNYYSDTSLIFKLYAPNKKHVFFLTYENNFTPDREYRMRQSTVGNYFWIELSKEIFTDAKNAYIYLIDIDLIADPYSTIVLDPFSDPWVPDDVMVDLPEYPNSRLPGMQVTVFDVEKPEYPWTDQDYEKPDKTNLVVYETLMRDFLSDRNYKSLLDTLDYFEKLGVNAIELMPVTEFESNGSWGYNIAFHMALDKEYGSRDQFKAFINEAHKRGISVIMDVVYNHVFSTSPLARLYWDDTNFRPTEENPWLNVTAKHPFNVGFDVNHESPATKEWVKQTLQYWIEEFHIDGFRFDLSKGFTQTYSTGDDVMRLYDSGRIATLKDYSDFVWSLDDETYVILEHFAANDEETELANYGMMIWGNVTHDFGMAAEGRSSSLDWADYTERQWDDPHIVGYMESHDEERIMYKVLNYGLSEGDYDTRELEIALKRVAAASAIFYMIPGPKMLWQFGELGYDYSINWCTNGTVNGCRLDPKPVRWDYLEDENRRKLNEIISNIIHLKTNYPTFSSTDFNFNDGNFFLKTIHFNHEEMDAVVMANYRVINSDINPKFQNEGTWYEYFTGDSLIVEDTQKKITHLPGEYRIYTNKRITPPNGFVTSTHDMVPIKTKAEVFPNPVINGDKIYISISETDQIQRIQLYDNVGRLIRDESKGGGSNLEFRIPTQIPNGLYYLKIICKETEMVEKIYVE